MYISTEIRSSVVSDSTLNLIEINQRPNNARNDSPVKNADVGDFLLNIPSR